MKNVIKIIGIFAVIGVLSVVITKSMGNKELQLSNTEEISTQGVEEINLSYVSENITIKESTSDKITVKEYLNLNEKNYYSSISKSGKTVTIERGKRPPINMVKENVEIYLPKNYKGSLIVTTVSGTIKVPDSEQLDITDKKASGTIGEKQEIKVELTATSGKIEVD